MTEKFQNKYRIASARLQNWNYASEGLYFITICTKNRIHYFGEIENGKLIISNTGVIADLMWHEIKNHTKNIELGEFVVMPNHIHGILIITDTIVQTLHATSLPDTPLTLHATSLPDTPLETLHATSLQRQRNEQMAKISPISNSISTIVRSYKSAVTKHAHRLGFEFGWQSRFYDIIIHNAQSFDNIQNYIANNPLNWKNDKFFRNE